LLPSLFVLLRGVDTRDTTLWLVSSRVCLTFELQLSTARGLFCCLSFVLMSVYYNNAPFHFNTKSHTEHVLRQLSTTEYGWDASRDHILRHLLYHHEAINCSLRIQYISPSVLTMPGLYFNTLNHSRTEFQNLSFPSIQHYFNSSRLALAAPTNQLRLGDTTFPSHHHTVW
jgi:hypothetical protein